MKTSLSLVLSMGISTWAVAKESVDSYTAAGAYLTERADADEFSGTVLVAIEGKVQFAKPLNIIPPSPSPSCCYLLSE